MSDIAGPFGEAITVNCRLGQQHLGPSQPRSSLWYEHIRLELQISLLCVSSLKSPLGKSPSRRSAQPPFATAFDAQTFIGQYSTVQYKCVPSADGWTGLDCVALRCVRAEVELTGYAHTVQAPGCRNCELGASK